MVVSAYRLDSDWFRRDSELGQMSMTCDKLSRQAPSVKSRLNGSDNSSAQTMLG